MKNLIVGFVIILLIFPSIIYGYNLVFDILNLGPNAGDAAAVMLIAAAAIMSYIGMFGIKF